MKVNELHRRNKHRGRYDLKLLSKSNKELASFVITNQFGDESIDFSNPKAVRALNKALLAHYYNVSDWQIPEGYLCPPVPGRADYIHYIADLITGDDGIPTGSGIRVLDIGTGANVIYPIIGSSEYKWSFVGSDIDPVSIKSAQKVLDSNTDLKENVELRLQKDKSSIFKGIIKEGEQFDLTMCNPPFHSSAQDALAGTMRKLKNLSDKKVETAVLNFGGKSNELWCFGGELKFISDMITESREFATSVKWFTTLVSKESNMNRFHKLLEEAEALEGAVFNMGQGNKTSRILAWTFQETESSNDNLSEKTE